MAATKLSAPSARRVYPRVSASERAKLRTGLAEDSDAGNVKGLRTGAHVKIIAHSIKSDQISIPEKSVILYSTRRPTF